ncbi:IclR family transcriptional regulator [Aestuariicella hydrocarbonica]|uniref:IclR family transcriptional regulator n=1 Tax=Pseudomaricurvus hydrocarbonicus TaxID=1470433 RepID=A0A9E5JSI0_9GAMM|nr:IclR family transcriptional regulator [Aestuariicella hydrocarbonica]NHO66012.1 IclR family transcriptional regulator [Aestuariicella hydrocarbonica]
MKNSGSPKLVKSAIRTMELFALFADLKKPLALADIAQALAAPKSSCHELIQTLVQLGYILVIDGGKSYYPSRRLLHVGEQINTFNPIKEKIEHELKRLRDLTGETVFIGRMQGQQAVYTDVFDGNHAMRFTAQAGDLNDLHVSSIGKALLAGMEEIERNQCIAKLKLKRLSDSSITGKKQLKENLLACGEQGVFTSVGESLPDVMGMAMPVKIQGHLLAFGLAGPITRVQKKLPVYMRALKESAEVMQRQ